MTHPQTHVDLHANPASAGLSDFTQVTMTQIHLASVTIKENRLAHLSQLRGKPQGHSPTAPNVRTKTLTM